MSRKGRNVLLLLLKKKTQQCDFYSLKYVHYARRVEMSSCLVHFAQPVVHAAFAVLSIINSFISKSRESLNQILTSLRWDMVKSAILVL